MCVVLKNDVYDYKLTQKAGEVRAEKMTYDSENDILRINIVGALKFTC